jgi:hypothetical protein
MIAEPSISARHPEPDSHFRARFLLFIYLFFFFFFFFFLLIFCYITFSQIRMGSTEVRVGSAIFGDRDYSSKPAPA